MISTLVRYCDFVPRMGPFCNYMCSLIYLYNIVLWRGRGELNRGQNGYLVYIRRQQHQQHPLPLDGPNHSAANPLLSTTPVYGRTPARFLDPERSRAVLGDGFVRQVAVQSDSQPQQGEPIVPTRCRWQLLGCVCGHAGV